MKRIVKIASVLAAAAALASCQKEGPANTETIEGKSGAVVPTEIVASFEATKVSYAAEGNNLRPSWEVGDQVIALDEEGANYKFTVKAVNEDKSAVLSGEAPADCGLHLIYCPGVSADKLTVDYTAQTGAQKTMPAVMFSDGKLENRTGEFKFRNAGAIIGISAVKGVPQGSKVTKITISGSNLSAAGIALSGSALALTATPKTDDAISVSGLDLTVNDANGTLSAPVFIAVPAGAKIKKVSASVAKEPETMTIPSTAADKKNIDYVEIEAKYDGTNLSTKKWAKWNVGANSQSDYGWYFAWSGTEGYVRYAETWQLHDATSIEFSYTLSSSKTAVASDYLYVKTQSFTPAGFSFNLENIHYHTGGSAATGWTKYVPTDKSSYWTGAGAPDNKLFLDPEDDAASVNWGGTWRMPTTEEFKALYNAIYWAWDATDKGYYVFSPDATHKAGKRVNSVPVDLNKADALLFFPAAGKGSGASLSDEVGSSGGYWSSSLYSPNPGRVYLLGLSNININLQNLNNRYYGYTVRPLSD